MDSSYRTADIRLPIGRVIVSRDLAFDAKQPRFPDRFLTDAASCSLPKTKRAHRLPQSYAARLSRKFCSRSQGDPRGHAMISSSASIGRCLGGVPSFDPQPVFFVPALDRQFGIAIEAVIIGANLRFDPARFIAQQQMNTRRRLR